MFYTNLRKYYLYLSNISQLIPSYINQYLTNLSFMLLLVLFNISEIMVMI